MKYKYTHQIAWDKIRETHPNSRYLAGGTLQIEEDKEPGTNNIKFRVRFVSDAGWCYESTQKGSLHALFEQLDSYFSMAPETQIEIFWKEKDGTQIDEKREVQHWRADGTLPLPTRK